MAKLKAILVETLLPAIKAVGKAEMEIVLLNVKEHQTSEIYQDTLRALHSSFSLLRDATLKTKSRIDDGIVNLVLEAVNTNAEAEGIVLS
jgi:hypothetical protein